MSDWTQVVENLVEIYPGTFYLRAKIGGKVIRSSERRKSRGTSPGRPLLPRSSTDSPFSPFMPLAISPPAEEFLFSNPRLAASGGGGLSR